ncbi:hypothetical protein [Microtetraspora sp. NBRC 16547]|uniref:hypothetical protein n=1 Tax=Microtetraspora sp. NBRC 16547 TaxID=3030993 RepID=UPI0024A53DEE|nr:hypothetical protein [Microtetraspora sp. NBRC 16547]GLW96087.1 hypothetical protein Misp02_01740 [Microtetraspora sp. NBRC 16547]
MQELEGLQEVKDELNQMRWSIDELRDTQEELDRRANVIEHQRLESLEYDLREAREEFSELPSELTKVKAALRRLVDRVASLEQNVQAASGAEPANLDVVDKTISTLAARTAKGREAQAALRTDTARTSMDYRIKYYQSLYGEYQGHLDQAMEHSKTLIKTNAGEAAHTKAAADFQTVLQQINKLAEQLGRLRPEYETAQRDLAADNARRATHGPAMMTGDAAYAKLHSLMRQRVALALNQRALLPVWFTTALGHPPPAQTDQWMYVAAEVLCFRISYNVTDLVVALGDPPAPARRARYAWYRELSNLIGKLESAA